MKVPFLDLKMQYQTIKDDVAVALNEVMENTAFAGGPFVEKFEQEFAEFCGTKYCVACNNGTSALWMPLIAAGVGPGDEVITVAHTFIATTEAISFCGATPVFVDIDETTFNMDANLIEAAITPKTKAIMPVHLYGQMADLDAIKEVADKHGLPIIEDSAQAVDGLYKGRSPGQTGLAAGFSFYPGKNLGAYGEGGATVTNDPDLAEKMRCFRDHGQAKKYYHKMIGWNCRMDGFQGAVLSIKLKKLPDWTDARRKNAELYNQLLAGIDGLMLPKEMDYAKHVYHLYVIRTTNRDDFMKVLAEKEIYCGIHYPIPVHRQEAYAHLGLGEGSFPISERVASEIVSLPMFPELTEEQVTFACNGIKEVLSVNI